MSSPDPLQITPSPPRDLVQNASPISPESPFLFVASNPQQPSAVALSHLMTLRDPTRAFTWLLQYFEESPRQTYRQKSLCHAFENIFGCDDSLSPAELLQATRIAFPRSELHREDFGDGLYVIQGLANRQDIPLEYDGELPRFDEALKTRVTDCVVQFMIDPCVPRELIDPSLQEVIETRRERPSSEAEEEQLKKESTTAMNEQTTAANPRILTTAEMVNEIYDTVVLEKFPVFSDGPSEDLAPITTGCTGVALQERSVNVTATADSNHSKRDYPLTIQPRDLMREVQSSPKLSHESHLNETLDLSTSEGISEEDSSVNVEPALEDVTGNTAVESIPEVAVVDHAAVTRLTKPQTSFYLPADRNMLTTFDFHPMHVAAIAKAAPLSTKRLFDKRKTIAEVRSSQVHQDVPVAGATNNNANLPPHQPPSETVTTSAPHAKADNPRVESPTGPESELVLHLAEDPDADKLIHQNSLSEAPEISQNVTQGDSPISVPELSTDNASRESSFYSAPELVLVDAFRSSSQNLALEVVTVDILPSSSSKSGPEPVTVDDVHASHPEPTPEITAVDTSLDSSPEIPISKIPNRVTTHASRKRVRIQESSNKEIVMDSPARKSKMTVKRWGFSLYTRVPPPSGPPESDEDTIRAIPPAKKRRESVSDEYTDMAKYEGPKPRVTFTLTNIVDDTKAISFLRKQRGSVNGTVARANIVCIGEGQLRKTSKLLLGIVQGRALVTDRWLKDSVQAGFLIDLERFFPCEPAREQEWNFSLRDAVETGPSLKTLLRGKTITLTASFRETLGDMLREYKALVKALGAKNIMDSLPPRSARRQSYMIIGTENDREDVTFARSNRPIWSRDTLPMSVLRGELQTGNEFMICGSAEESFGEGEL